MWTPFSQRQPRMRLGCGYLLMATLLTCVLLAINGLIVINLVNPDRVVIGGGVSRAGDLLFGPIEQTVQSHIRGIPGDGVRILRARLGDEAGPRGAAALVFQRLFPHAVVSVSRAAVPGG